MKTLRLLITKGWLFIACLFLLSSCYDFIYVTQQNDVQSGTYMFSELCVYINNLENKKCIPYVGLLLPKDFTMDDYFIYYHLDHDCKTPAGLIKYSASLSLEMHEIEPAPNGYFWWVGIGNKPISEKGAYVAYPGMKSSVKCGNYYIDYMIGDNVNGLNVKRSNQNLIEVKDSRVPTYLKVYKEFENNLLTWHPTLQQGYLKGYNIYRNEVKLNDNFVTHTYYYDENPPAGKNVYRVTAYYMKYGETKPSADVFACNCPTGPALTFDGNNSQVFVMDDASLNLLHSFSAETWINLEPGFANGKNTIITKGLPGKGYKLFAKPYGDTYRVGIELADITLASNQIVKANEWHHVAVTWDGIILKLFIDGIPDNKSNVFTLLYADETPLFIGKDGLTKTEAFKGSIDNLRLWNIARTDEQIAEFRTLPLEGTEEGLIGYWKFDDGCNQFACDLSQNGNDGYLMGSCWCSSSFPYIPDIHAVEGALFEVPVNFCQKPSTDFQRVVMDIKYNPKLLEFLKVDLVGTAFEKWEIVTGYSPGKLKISIKNTGLALLESNTLIKLRFKALFPQLQDVIMLNSFKIDQTPLRTMSGKVVVAQPGYKEQFVEKSSTVSSYNNLLNVYPNPASNNTTFSYVLPENGQVEILIFNLNGQVVSTLVNENQVAGTYNYRADVSNLPPGIYFYTLKTGNSAISGKLIVN